MKNEVHRTEDLQLDLDKQQVPLNMPNIVEGVQAYKNKD